MAEESTGRLMKILGEDVERCRLSLRAALEADKVCDGSTQLEAEFHARQLFRAAFAFIEAVTYSAKVRAAAHLVVFGPGISDAETFLATDRAFKLKSNGEVGEDAARIRLADNIRFAIALTERAKSVTDKFDPNTEWWSCLINSIRVRHRLTHPKNPGDVDLIAQEVADLLKAYAGFNVFFDSLPPYPDIPADKVGFL